MIKRHLSTGRELVIVFREGRLIPSEELFDGFNTVPYVVLLSAHTHEESLMGLWKKTVNSLIRKGAKYFVCVGDFSERLHDNLDDFLFPYDDKGFSNNISMNIITTFHKDDSFDEIIDYYVFATPSDKNECLYAILDNKNKKDIDFMECLVNS